MRMVVAISAILLLILHPVAGSAKATKEMMCTFEQPSGGTLILKYVFDESRPGVTWLTSGTGYVPMEIRYSFNGMTFFGGPPGPTGQMTAVTFTGHAAHSRHTIVNGEITVVQYIGRCR